MPAPNEHAPKQGKTAGGDDAERACSNDQPFSAQVFKTLTDNFVGKISLFKVYSGKMTVDTPLYNPNSEKSEKAGNLYYMLGKKTYNIDAICAGRHRRAGQAAVHLDGRHAVRPQQRHRLPRY